MVFSFPYNLINYVLLTVCVNLCIKLVKNDYHYIRMHGQQNIKICTAKQVYLYKTIIKNMCMKLVKKITIIITL